MPFLRVVHPMTDVLVKTPCKSSVAYSWALFLFALHFLSVIYIDFEATHGFHLIIEATLSYD
jgi:hypothetical protein